ATNLAGPYNVASFWATAPDSGAVQTRLVVDWGDGATTSYPSSTSYGEPGTTYYPTHNYATIATYTVTLTCLDSLGQSAATSRSVVIHRPPTLTSSVSDVKAIQATLNAQSGDFGGASSASLSYAVYNGSYLIATSPTFTAT